MKKLYFACKERVVFLWCIAFLALAGMCAFAEEAAAVTADEPVTTSLFELVFFKGGPFMYIILALSVGMVYLIVDAILVTRVPKLLPEADITQLKELGAQGKTQEAIVYCEENPSPITRIIAASLRVQKRGKTAMEETLAEHGAREVSAFHTRLSYLNTIATIAPMLGLLGTVSGMIKAFGNIAELGMGRASVLADNISEALLTTAGGLIIAIPAMAAFFFFRNRVNDLMVRVEDTVGEIIETFYT